MRQLPAKAGSLSSGGPPCPPQHSAQRRRRSPDFFIRKAVLLSPAGTVPSLTLSSVSRPFSYIFLVRLLLRGRVPFRSPAPGPNKGSGIVYLRAGRRASLRAPLRCGEGWAAGAAGRDRSRERFGLEISDLVIVFLRVAFMDHLLARTLG